MFIRCQYKRIFVKNDPFHYRLDMIVFLCSIPMIIVWFFVTLPQFFIAPLIDLLIFSGFLVSGFLAFLITILKLIYRLIKKNFSKKDLNFKNWGVSDVIDENIIDLFTEFCESEWSSENILLKKQIMDYKKMILIGDRKKLCSKIKNQYLLRNSPLEVNCPQNILALVVKNIDEESFGEDLFLELEKQVDLNLKDTISRFRFSDLYKGYLIDIKNSNKSLGFR
jgi:hypothetical protein